MSNFDINRSPSSLENQAHVCPTRWREEAETLLQCTEITLTDMKAIEQSILESPFSNTISSILGELFDEKETQSANSLEAMGDGAVSGGGLKGLEALFEEKRICEELTDNMEEYHAKINNIEQVFNDEHENLKKLCDEHANGILSVFQGQPKFIPIQQYLLDEIVKGANGRTQILFNEMKTNVELAMSQVKSNHVEERPTKRRKRQFNYQANELLNEYFYSHLDNLYPSEEVKVELSVQCSISVAQVNNWFDNKRIKYKRNTGKTNIRDTEPESALASEENTCTDFSTSDDELDNFNDYTNGFC